MKKPVNDPFLSYMLTHSEEERALLHGFFEKLPLHLDLGREQNARMIRDFEEAFLSYEALGVPLAEALRRLEPANLQGFFARETTAWYPLDSAAKVYPLTMGHGKMAVFRLAVQLKSPIEPALLQMALHFTLPRFPGFAVTLKKGFFWHYLDAWKGCYPVYADDRPPCRAMKLGRTGTTAFRVLYHGSRLSCEFFHVLTDGTGGMVFLKTLTAEYLRLLGKDSSAEQGVLDLKELPREEEYANEFPRVLRGKSKGGFADRGALQLGGRLSRVNPCRILHFKMDADKLLSLAKSRGCTVTAYLSSRLICACRSAMELQKGDISVQIPVNMRKFYPSPTLRNFSLYCGIRIPAGQASEPDKLLPEILRQMEEKAGQESMGRMVASTESLVQMARYLPLKLKGPVVQAVYGVLGDRIFTTTLSNLGVVRFPEEIAGEVMGLDFVLGTARVNRALCGLVTYGNVANFSIAKQTKDPTQEETLLRLLEADGLSVRVEGSQVYAY